jgi:hypothetical protein
VFVPNVVVWEREFNGPTGMVADYIRDMGRDVAIDARVTAPRKTGMMAISIAHRAEGPTAQRVSANTTYAIFVHEGTKAHTIRPKGPGYPLRFFWPKVGRNVAFMKVRHPGTKAQPFLTDSLSRVMRRYTSR